MRNLEAEMTRFGVSNSRIAELLNCSLQTVSNKVSGKTEFGIKEAFKIRDAFFPSLRIEYLFAEA